MRFLHLSDIHFCDEEINASDDPNRGLRSDTLEDVKLMTGRLGAPDVIVLSGDVAFKGAWTEYTFALKWLEEKLCPAAGSRLEAMFICPGNHDVDRKAGGGTFISLIRNELRSSEPNKCSEASCRSCG
jgi:3',5'-cyclic AMP phosphodiesterase CpdA